MHCITGRSEKFCCLLDLLRRQEYFPGHFPSDQNIVVAWTYKEKKKQ